MHPRMSAYPLALFLISFPMWSGQVGAAKQEAPVETYEKQNDLLFEARKLILAGDAQKAIDGPLTEVIKFFESKYKEEKRRIYCASGQVETLAYLLTAAKDQVGAIALNCPWGTAYFMKGYALQDRGNQKGAMEALEKAVALSPSNSQYLSELGHCYQLQKDWQHALEKYEAAEEGARLAPAPEQKDADLARAMRGTAYVFVELGRLQEAAKKYELCLEINPKDSMASNELTYVQGLLKNPK